MQAEPDAPTLSDFDQRTTPGYSHMAEHSSIDRLTDAYDRMMERVHDATARLERAEEEALPHFQRAVEEAAETAVELGELSREEADLIAAYLRRDLHDAGRFLAETGRGLRDWLRFDLEYIEDRLLALFAGAADGTRLEILRLEAAAERASHYHTGEITGPGTLRCEACGKELHFHATSRIPPCPACHAALFTRADETA